MNVWLTAEALAKTPPRQLFLNGIMLISVACALLRTAGNLREIRRLQRFGLRRAGYYAIRVWGISCRPLRIFLVAECLIIDALCVLVLLVISNTSLW